MPCFFFKFQEKDYDIEIFDAFKFNIPELLCISFWFWIYIYIFCAILYYSLKITKNCPKRIKRLKFQPAVFSHSAYSPHSFLFKRFFVFIPSLLCISHTNRSHSLDCNLFRWKLAKLKFCNFQNLQNWRKMNFSSQLCKIDAKLTFHWNFSFRSPWNCFWCGCQRLRDEGFCRILQKWKILQNSILIRVDESHQSKKGTLILTNCVSPKISFLNETTSYNTNQWIATASLRLVSDPVVVSRSIVDWSNVKILCWCDGYGLLFKHQNWGPKHNFLWVNLFL